MPHLLIAGATGSGKSIGINGRPDAALLNSPADLRLILVDPNEWSLPNITASPSPRTGVTEPDKPSCAALGSGRDGTTLPMFSEIGSRDIHSYNEKMEKMWRRPKGRLSPVDDRD